MLWKPSRAGFTARLTTRPDLAKHGITALAIGRNSVKICRNGRYIGLWREVAGAFVWQPANSEARVRRVFNADAAVKIFEHEFQLSSC